MDPQALKELIEGSKILQKARGGSKGPLDQEKSTIDFAGPTFLKKSLLF